MTTALRVPFHRADVVPDEDVAALLRVLRSGWLTTGAEAEAFEREFCAYTGAAAAVAVSSCTAALHLALKLLNIGPGDTVAVPTLTFTATAAVVRQVGSRLLLVDVDPETGNVDVDRLPEHGIRAIVWVHFGGNPTGFARCLDWARAHGVSVIEDAAHALGTAVGEQRIGNRLGDAFAAFSFYPTKPLTTAEGGMLTLPTDAEARARRLSLHGIDRDVYQRSRGAVYHYDVVEEGYKYNLPDLLAALGRSQIPRLDAARQRREQIAMRYQNWLGRWVGAGLRPFLRVEPGVTSAWHLFVLRLVPEVFRWSRDEIAAALRDRHGVGTSVHYRPLHRHTYYSQGVIRDDYRGADEFYAGCLSLPIYSGLTDADAHTVASAVDDVLTAARR